MSHTAEGANVSPKTRHVRAIQTALFAFCLSVFLLTFNTRLASVDALIMYETTASLAERGSFSIEDTRGAPGRDGRYYSKYGPLQSLLGVPLYLAGAAASHLGPLRPQERHLKRAAVSLLNPLVTALAAALLFGLAVRLGLSLRRALASALLFAFGTVAWYYSKTFFSEPLTSLLLLGAFTQGVAYRQEGQPRRLWLSGLFAGLAVATRFFAIVAAPVLLLYILPRDGRKWRALLRFCVPLAAVGALLVAYNYARYGSLLETGYGDEGFTTPLWVGLSGLLASPRCGMLFYCPALFLAVPGFRVLARRCRREAWAMGALAGVWTLLISTWWAWWAGGAWGPRLLVPLFPFLSIAAVAALPPVRRASRAFLVAAALLAGANIALQATSLLVTNARWEYTASILAAQDGQDGMWGFRYMPLLLQARAVHGVLAGRTPVAGDTVVLGGAEEQAGARTPTEVEALLRRADMHVVDFWPVLFALYGLPVKIILPGVVALLAAAGGSLAALLSLMHRPGETAPRQ